MVLAESWFAYDFVKACLPNSIFWNTLSSIDALLSQGSLNENTRKIVKGQKNSLLVTFGAEGLATLDLPVRIYNIISENKKSESQRNREKESSEKVNPNQEL